MHLASIQMSVVEGDKKATIAKATKAVCQCAEADLVILPEIWNVGFMSFEQYISEAEEKDGPTMTALTQAAKEAGVYLHSGSFVEKDGDAFYNASYLISPQGEILGHYRKIHLFGYNSRETQILTPGDAIAVVDTPLGKLGMATCYDLRFPELFRRMTAEGAGILLVCSAWPYPRLEHWLMLNRVRALENQCFLMSANSVGFNQGAQFVGHSMIVDPWGVILASGGDEEVILKTEIDWDALKTAREKFPALADRKSWLS